MSDSDPGPRPEPQEDPPPDGGPGGPSDRVQHDENDLPPATPDQPRSAQVEQKNVPDEIEQAEEMDEEEKDVDSGTEAPA